MKPIDAFLSGIASMVIIVLVVAITVKRNESNKPAEQPTGIIVIGGSFNSDPKTVIIIKDTRNNRQWDAIEYSNSLVIIPGTEKPIK